MLFQKIKFNTEGNANQECRNKTSMIKKVVTKHDIWGQIAI